MLAKLVSCYLLSASLSFISGICEEQSFFFLNEEEFDYVILPNEKEMVAHWKIAVQGSPLPTIYLYADNERIDSGSSKYEYNITNSEIFVKIRNVSENVLNTKFSLFAENLYENRTLNLAFKVTNLFSDGIEVHFLNETDSIIKCVVTSVLKPDITWLPCSGNDIDEITCLDTPIKETDSERTELQLTSYLHIKSSWDGFLKCVARNSIHSVEHRKEITKINGSMEIISYWMTLLEIDKKTKMGQVTPPEEVYLWCGASALNHTDKITWVLNSIENDIKDDDERVGSLVNTVFGFWREFIFNIYDLPYVCFCKTWLKNGTMEYRRVEFTEESRRNGTEYNVTNIYNATKVVSEINEWIYYGAGILFIVVVIISVCITMKMRAYQKFQKEIYAGLVNFEKGALEHLNANLTLDDQADLLPYDKSYEFPSDQLKLGDVIGTGAFGVVVKGEARNLLKSKPITTVAVKMVNRNLEDICIKALASELKVMIHLGKHVNVVNLLGACTKNIMKRELLVIVEYCRFGNVKDYLLFHRNSFINQINAETGQIDLSTKSDELAAKDTNSNCTYEQQGSSGSYEPSPSDNEKINQENAQINKNVNYKGDYNSINKPVCTRDLLLWSFQVARGMEYLSSRKVLHGDLAARNILLTDGNVVKICDFGLARKMYQSDIYKKKGDEMLPVKWMAIEAITDRLFSVQSDVWSFGIVLWEIFSLARIPYPGMEFNESFCEKLLDGYRMKSPQFATQTIYEIMLHCWHPEPSRRPSFTELSQEIGSLLEETIREHYIDMNAGYVKLNAQKFKEENADYLSMVGAPDFTKYSSPCSYSNIAKPSLDEEVNTSL